MKTRSSWHTLVLVVSLGAWIAPGNSHADDLAARGREVFEKHRSAVVTVQVVMRSKMNLGGLGGGDEARESREEITGTVIDPAGLTVISLSTIDPMGMLQGIMGALGGGNDEDGDFRLRMESEVTDVKLLSQDGNEVPAEIVLRDRDLDLAFIRPKTKPSAPMPALNIQDGATVDILDEVIAINRLGRVAGRVHAASVERIQAVVRRPRLFYIPSSSETSTSLGCPAFTQDGRFVGVFVMRSTGAPGGGGASLFSGQMSDMTPVLRPAEDIRKSAAQVPSEKSESN